MKKIMVLFLSLISNVAFTAQTTDVIKTSQESINYFIWTVIAAAFALGVAAAICGIAQALAIRRGLEGIARQPEATGQIQTAMILGLAFIESLVIYVLLVSLILLFANPFLKYFAG